jgi:hypothetical protein
MVMTGSFQSDKDFLGAGSLDGFFDFGGQEINAVGVVGELKGRDEDITEEVDNTRCMVIFSHIDRDIE